MDDKRFDALVKSLAGQSDRRTALKGFLGLGGAVAGVVVLGSTADAARRGFSGPSLPKPVTPAPCQPNCGNGLCGIPDGCGATCACSGFQSCIEGVCAPPCEPAQCTICITDGPNAGCFWETTLTCSDNGDCQAQFGGALCEPTQSGQNYCFTPHPN